MMQYTLIGDSDMNKLTERVNQLTEVGFKIDKAYCVRDDDNYTVDHYVWLVKE